MADWRLDYTRPGECPETARLAALAAAYQALVGHDLPNQLVAAGGLARLLADADRLGAEEKALAKRLADLVREADGRCRRLAEVGRLLRGPMRGPALSLGEVVEEAVVVTRAAGHFPGVGWAVAVQEATTDVGRALLHQVLVELIRNAAAAARPPGGEVRVEAGPVSGGAEVRIIDPGPGPAARPAAIAPLGHWGSVPIPGAGLLLVHQAVAIWRGRLAMSAGSEGCTVALFLPDRVEGDDPI